ncbi:EscU/YscU/HrcU family type III secretion system export apparatus switch protein [Sandaracinobacter sp. RS1-74]|uniref:EscU/YscU/HrcU family type III secretion system export apparatus switch protein n=1 Tax=Sandaracinobacteroides sayramensis TaxID=2913411 RepID=UPI001EDC8513|nr:EscU/YscU/HrcU family type III secretion system export apparatus switch protein [Sandaracinobacteroides sayramensis]MCG2841952.1 EscU/YscU/HrcU family type III secretion system export apparatus switch protein [Sandaracinobacteroides sayramensis]
MAEQAPKDERTEAPTPRRREQAREKGDRLASRELATALAGAAGALWLWAVAPAFGEAMHMALFEGLRFGHAEIRDFRPVDALAARLWPLAGPLAALAALALVAAVMGQGITGGIGFTPGQLAPNWSRLNPAAGFKRIFGSRGLIELMKAVLKAAVLFAIAGWTLKGAVPLLAGLSAMPGHSGAYLAAGLALKLVLALILGLALIGAVDLPIQIRLWLQRLRMTKQDVKEEMKQQEGSPEMKQAMRRLARDTLKRANRAAMADATVVLTNPTHFAVALRYRPEQDAAPVIVARGRGVVAQAIRELAAERDVTTLSYPSVTRALYFTGRVGMAIRADLYAAVATILAFVLRVGQPGAQPPPAEAPDGARFDEHGRPEG